MGSTAGRIAYEGGGGYTAAKHGTRVITETLRLELVGEPLRFTEIAPGMVSTEEFALIRFGGDRDGRRGLRRRARAAGSRGRRRRVRLGRDPPRHVNIDELVIRPRAQAAQHKVHRVG